MTPAHEEATRIAAAIERFEIRPKAFDARQLASFSPGAEYSAAVESQIGQELTPSGFRLNYRFTLEATAEGEKSPYVRLSYELDASYDLRSERADGEVTGGEIRAFAHSNGLLHAYPYFRVYVQLAMGQLSLPPITLPVHLVGVGPAPLARRAPAD